MAAPVQPLPPLRAPDGPAPATPDQAYWKTFRNQLLLPSPHNAAISSIHVPDFNPTGTEADAFAVTSGGRIQLFGTKTRKVVKTITRFGVDDIARSGALRRDGRIVLAGGDSGVVQAFDTSSRAILRQWRGEHAHKQPVHLVRWNPSVLTDFMSVSDDRTVRVWDLTEDVAKWTGIGHEDYVRSGCYLPDQETMVVSGSYDRTVRIWDTRQPGNGRAALTFKHAAPIEHVLPLNSATLASAAGNEVSILNLTAGKADHIIRSHQKTVTALTTAQKGSRLLTGALDGHVKMHNTTSWEVVAGFKYSAPILSLAVVGSGTRSDREDRHLAVGLQTGLMSLRTRLAGAEKAKAREREKKMQAMIAGEADEYERKQRKRIARQGTQRADRGKDFRGEGIDIIIEGINNQERRKKLSPWQRSLRSGKYGLALDQVLSPKGEKALMIHEHVLALITALRHRSALRSALAQRDPHQLMPILNWCLKYIARPRDMDLVYDVLLLLLDMYSPKFGSLQDQDDGSEWKPVYQLLSRVGKRVRVGLEHAQTAHSTMGVLEMLESG